MYNTKKLLHNYYCISCGPIMQYWLDSCNVSAISNALLHHFGYHFSYRDSDRADNPFPELDVASLPFIRFGHQTRPLKTLRTKLLILSRRNLIYFLSFHSHPFCSPFISSAALVVVGAPEEACISTSLNRLRQNRIALSPLIALSAISIMA